MELRTKKDIIGLTEKYGLNVPEEFFRDLREDINYLNFPFHLVRYKGGLTGDTLEVYRVVINDRFKKLFHERYSRGNCSTSFWKNSKNLTDKEFGDIPELLNQDFTWDSELAHGGILNR